MIPRHRLCGRRRFVAIRSGGTRAAAGPVRVMVLPNQLDVSRVGFALPRQAGAVQRNRVRRRLRAAITPRLADLAGLDVVVTAEPEAISLSWKPLCAALEEALEQARRKCPGAPSPTRRQNGAVTGVRDPAR